MKFVFSFLCLIVIFGCAKNHGPLSSNSAKSNFGIYFLQDSTLTEREISQININSLVLMDDPWLSQNEIDFYDYSSHSIYLKNDKSYLFDNYNGHYFQFNTSLTSKPFVVVSGDERCYIGALHSLLLSVSPSGPYIDELDIGYYPRDILHISKAWTQDGDIRSHSKIEEVLKAHDLFNAGLEVELFSFRVLDNGDTATVEYTIKIKNNDQDDLFVIDPEKMGSNLFHHYTNGPDLWDNSTHRFISSQYKIPDIPEPYDSWHYEWFTLIKSNQSKVFTIRLKGYPHIPVGNYKCSMIFSNPINISKEKRYTAGGRIWVGSISSNDLTIVVQ